MIDKLKNAGAKKNLPRIDKEFFNSLQPLTRKVAKKVEKTAAKFTEDHPLNEESNSLESEEKKAQTDDLTTDEWNSLLKIGAAVGVAVVGYKIIKKLTDEGNLSQDQELEESGITQAKVQSIVSTLYAAMDRPGTDEVAILQALNGLNYNDFVKVSDAFGRRSYAGFGYSPLPFVPELTLVEWLIEELDPENLKELRKILPDAF